VFADPRVYIDLWDLSLEKQLHFSVHVLGCGGCWDAGAMRETAGRGDFFLRVTSFSLLFSDGDFADGDALYCWRPSNSPKKMLRGSCFERTQRGS
jgi:hypothetical protein